MAIARRLMLEINSKEEMEKFFEEIEDFINKQQRENPEVDYELHLAAELSMSPSGETSRANTKPL